MRSERQLGEFRYLFGSAFSKFRMSIEASADRRSTNRQIEKAVNREPNPLQIALDQRGPTRDFLTQGQRCSILEMSSSGFNDVNEFLRLGLEHRVQLLQRRNEVFS